MRYIAEKNQITVFDTVDLDPAKTLECGQCFRWNEDSSGVYTGVFRGGAAKVWSEDGTVIIRSDGSVPLTELISYFDLDRDYETIRSAVGVDAYMQKAAEFGKGIRILRQDPWEVLCSFIISQCNNIPRIKKIVEALCRHFGEPFSFEGRTFYTFPSAERLAALSPDELAPLKCGYRDVYMINAAKAVAGGTIDLCALAGFSYEDALGALKSLDGIGDKVANCVILFGLQMLGAFPIDVWIRKVLDAHYGKDFSPSVFGEYAGIAQQYMFYYARSCEN